jgi:hypothetical protein
MKKKLNSSNHSVYENRVKNKNLYIHTKKYNNKRCKGANQKKNMKEQRID